MQPNIEVKIPKTEAGVLIARFQVPFLHEAHKKLIDFVQERHKKVLIFIGISPCKVTRNNPLDYFTRMKMVQGAYPNIIVLPIYDTPSDEQWSKNIDHKIREVFEVESVTLYGSRDSFVPQYSGHYPVVELDSSYTISGSEIRKIVSEEVRESEDFRAGVIYAAHATYPKVFPTVDVVITRNNKTEMLLARKKSDPEGQYRFIGGFLDPRQDKCFEDAAIREAYEETGGSLELDIPEYVGSTLIDDWRYRNEIDKIVTTVYHCECKFGMAKASDDIDEVKWFNIEKLILDYNRIVVKQHLPIFKMMFGIE